MAAVYSTKSKGIGGQIKRRYTDFIVEEIGQGGRLCKVERFLKEEKGEKKISIPENKGGKDFLYLDLEKINKDLNYCIRKLARFLQCGKKKVGYAGLKDKRAVSCQQISIYKPNIARLEEFDSRGIDLRNPKWADERIEIGDLKGNYFTIVIRDIDLEKEELKKRLQACFKEIGENGVANFFGEQRFGGIRQVTHLVGREFVKGNPEAAVMLYLTATCQGEDDEISHARTELLETKDFSKASNSFPVKYRYERAIIHHLCKYPKDFVGAFHNLPKPLRYLFTHAYQSHLFNLIIEERMKAGWHLKKVEGDILMDGVPTAPLLGFESKFTEGEPGEIEKRVLEQENMPLQNFKVKEMPELSSKGARRKILLQPEKLKLLEVNEDEFFPGRNCAKISFELKKGSYATTVMREIMKVEK